MIKRLGAPSDDQPSCARAVARGDWRLGLPTLCGSKATLRELRVSDAATLFLLLSASEVTRFISPPPDSVAAFERFIVWAGRQRMAGSYACFAVTLDSCDTAIGVFQLRELDPKSGAAEWGFAIGSSYWGSGVFQDAATLMANFAFDVAGVHRLEARAAVRNGRGNGALRSWRCAGRRAAKIVSQGRRVSRSGALDDSRRRLARHGRRPARARTLTRRVSPAGSPRRVEDRAATRCLPPGSTARSIRARRARRRLLCHRTAAPRRWLTDRSSREGSRTT